jgi:hypothetical protein
VHVGVDIGGTPVTPVSPLSCVQSAATRVTSSGKVLNDPARSVSWVTW